MPRHGAGEDSAHPHASVVDLDSVTGVRGSDLEIDPLRRMVGPAKTVRWRVPRAEADAPTWEGERDRFTGDEIKGERLRRLWWFEPEPVTGKPDPPSPAEGHCTRPTGGDELLEELGLTSGHPVKTDPTRLRVQPTGAERGWEITDRGHGHAAVRLPGIDPRCPCRELLGEKGLVRCEGRRQVHEMPAQRRAPGLEAGRTS